MKSIFIVGTICIFTLILASCGFPSHRLLKVTDCSQCGAVIQVDAELAFVKETRGKKWRVWQQQSDGRFKEVCRDGTVKGEKLKCDGCGEDKSLIFEKTSSSDCPYDNCVRVVMNGTQCPGGGQGTGGSN